MNPYAVKRKRKLAADLETAVRYLNIRGPLTTLTAAQENNATLMEFDATPILLQIVEAVVDKAEAEKKSPAKKKNGDS